MKKQRIISVISAAVLSATTISSAALCTYADDMVYSDFNANDVNGTVTVNIPEDTTAEVMITFTSPEVTDEPYFIKTVDDITSGSMQIEGRDTTENDFRDYTLHVSVKRNESGDIVSYADTFNIPDGNDNPESFTELIYNFSFDDDFSGSDWTLSSETKNEKNIILHYGTSITGEMTGDVNGDGLIDAVDSSLVLVEYAALSTEGGTSTFTEKQKIYADVNSDGIIDAVDGSLILAYYAVASTSGTPAWEDILEDSGNETTTTTATTETSATETTTTTTAVTAPDYSSYVEAVQLLDSTPATSITHREYYVYDIDGDGTYELITETGTSEEDDTYSVYSMKDGEMIFAGDIDAGYSHLSEKDGTLYKVYGQGQTADVDKISFDGEKITMETIGTETDIDTGNYITAYTLSDMSGLNRIMNSEPYTYFDTTYAGEDFIFGLNDTGIVKVSNANLRLRAKPTTASDIITEMPNNSEVHIYGKNENDWAYVSYKSGGKTYYGYASTLYIEIPSLTTTTTTTTTTATTTTTTTTTVVTAPEVRDYVYITATGKKYHYENPCGKGTYYEATLEYAESLGLTPCEKCVLH